MRFLILLFSLFIFTLTAKAQSVYAPLNKDYYHYIDRYEILSSGLSEKFHSSVKAMRRKDIAGFVDSLQIDSLNLSKADLFNLNYLKRDNWIWEKTALPPKKRKGFLNTFYKSPEDLYSVKTDGFILRVNPALYFSAGKDFSNNKFLYINTRGAQISGLIDGKVGFYAFAADNQASFPSYVADYIQIHQAVPEEGYTKPFKKGGYDFITARGYITFSLIKHIQVQFGYDKNFIGDGYRSLILSDFSSNYAFLKLNTHVWKLNYTNIFAQLNADVFYLNKLLPKKYLAFHHLSANIGKHLNIGLFESVIISRGDSGKGAMDISYLNPIIFYRSIEQQRGSQDNALLGLDFKLNFLRHFSFYGQLVLDEFLLKHIKAQDGWWANKQAGQLGLKYINAGGVKNLDLQVETNIIRPYTYTHESKQTAYTHYNHSLAHPLGANLYELLGIIKYQPWGRLSFTGKFFHTVYGADDKNTNWGENLLLPYTTRQQTFNNKIGQGYRTTINYLSLTGTWQVAHNVFIDVSPVVRLQHSQLAPMNKNDKFVTMALRWNVAQRQLDF